MATTTEEERREARELRELPGWLWKRLRADPIRAPEHIALAAADRHAPAAAEWAESRRALYAYGPRELALMASKRHVQYARLAGAATGIGGFATLVIDAAALAWIQSRLVFFVAAAYGYDPFDRMRPAELLVIQGIYPDPTSARSALDGAGKTMAEAWTGSRVQRDEQLLLRLVRFGSGHAVKRLGGKAIPGFAIAFNAVTDARDTKAVGKRAIAFYGG